MELLQEVTWRPRERPLVYVCGPTPFVEKATISLIALGHEPGPGEVARCRHCGSVVMVFVEARGVTCVDLRGLAALDPA
jgi:hypothetical protein